MFLRFRLAGRAATLRQCMAPDAAVGDKVLPVCIHFSPLPFFGRMVLEGKGRYCYSDPSVFVL